MSLASDDRTAKILWQVTRCRRGELGGRFHRCDSCGSESLSLKSCGDRHCVVCSKFARREWFEDVKSWALPCDYLHQVTTLPHELNDLISANRRILMGMLFDASRDAQLRMARDQHGIEPGLLMALHSWGQQQNLHYHVHTIQTAGGWLIRDHDTWKPIDIEEAEEHPAELAKRFKALYLKKLRKWLTKGSYRVPPSLQQTAGDESTMNAEKLASLLSSIDSKDWVVDIQGTPAEYRGTTQSTHVFGYLAAYVFGGPIGDSRILQWQDGRVIFDGRDYKNGGRLEINVSETEFCRQYNQHFFPSRFHRVRFAGLFRKKDRCLRLAQALAAIDTLATADAEKEFMPLFDYYDVDVYDITASGGKTDKSGNTVSPEGEQEAAEEETLTGVRAICRVCAKPMPTQQEVSGEVVQQILQLASWAIALLSITTLEQYEHLRRSGELVSLLQQAIGQAIKDHQDSVLNDLAQQFRTYEDPFSSSAYQMAVVYLDQQIWKSLQDKQSDSKSPPNRSRGSPQRNQAA